MVTPTQISLVARGETFRPSTMNVPFSEAGDPGAIGRSGRDCKVAVPSGFGIFSVPEGEREGIRYLHNWVFPLMPHLRAGGATDFCIYINYYYSEQCALKYEREEVRMLSDFGCEVMIEFLKHGDEAANASRLIAFGIHGSTAVEPPCGARIAGSFEPAITASSPSPTPQPPALWNPNAAANWSLLFSPAFGAYLHGRNAEALGRTDEARANKVWFYVSLAYLGFSLVSDFVLTIPDGVFRLASVVLLLGWYFTLARSQIQFVRVAYNARYDRKPWMTPLLIGFGCLIGLFVVIVAVGSVQDSASGTP